MSLYRGVPAGGPSPDYLAGRVIEALAADRYVDPAVLVALSEAVDAAAEEHLPERAAAAAVREVLGDPETQAALAWRRMGLG